MKRYKRSEIKESNSKAVSILNKSKITDDELYSLLMETGHKTTGMWKNDRSNLVMYIVDMLER